MDAVKATGRCALLQGIRRQPKRTQLFKLKHSVLPRPKRRQGRVHRRLVGRHAI